MVGRQGSGSTLSCPGFLPLWQDPEGKPKKTTIQDNQDGTYTVSYVPDMTGRYTILIKYGGDEIPLSPYRVRALPTGDASKCTVTGESTGRGGALCPLGGGWWAPSPQAEVGSAAPQTLAFLQTPLVSPLLTAPPVVCVCRCVCARACVWVCRWHWHLV